MGIGPWELLLLLGLVAILVTARHLLRLSRPGDPSPHTFLLWAAQGFGLGRIPWAPGTFGSLGGLLWLIVSLGDGSLARFVFAQVVAIGFSIRACGVAEQVLRQKDPGSVVLDEIVAVPLCFVAWIAIVAGRTGAMPAAEYFFSRQTVLFTLGIFVLFRLFDIAKPWPVRGSQSLPGGWGVTVDDLLAAVYVNLVVLLVFLVKHWF
jgi:phosphatidylglycerophosphatase A